MAFDYFLDIEGIKGEAEDFAHREEMELLSWRWGASYTGQIASGSDQRGKTHIKDLVVTKYIDRASPTLLQRCCSGTESDKATLTCRKAGMHGAPLEYLKIELRKVLITSIDGGVAAPNELGTETITLNFGKVRYTYTPQSDTGLGLAMVDFEWDIEMHRAMEG